MLDFAASTDALVAAIVAWAHRNQPDLFQNPANRAHGLTFEADMLNHAAADLSIRIKLTESVVVTTGAGGAREIQRVDDSIPANKDWDAAAWVAGRDMASGAIPRE
jgi:hypothetical protein